MKRFSIFHFPYSILRHPLFAGSFVMVVGTNLFNFGQFVYHFVAARSLERVYGEFLGKAYYGDVATIISILGIIGIIQLSLSLTVVKFIASAKNNTSVANLAKWINWWSIWLGVFTGGFILILSPFLVTFLNMQQPASMYILIPILLFFLVLTAQRAILQGILSFNKYVFTLLVEVAVKILLTVVFIFLGFAVVGAIGAVLVGLVCALLVTRVSLYSYLRGKRGVMPHIGPLVKYSIPVFIQGLALTSMYSTDLLLVKHFFSAEEAGVYASLAVLGRVAFFGASPVIHVMFPLIARRFSHSQPYHTIFYLSIFLVSGIALGVALFYWLFPEIPIGVLYGRGYLMGAPMLWWFGIFMTLLVLSMLFTQFYLSINKTRVVWFFVVAALLQILLIWFIHPTLLRVIQISIVCAALLLLSLLVYFPYHNHKK